MLLRIHEAANRQNFLGTLVIRADGAMSSARVAHFCQGSNQFERSESLDGPPRHTYRHNDVVATSWPTTKTATVEQRGRFAQFPALSQTGADRITESYHVRLQGAERIAGRRADVLTVEPRDALRYGYRLWADRVSGLLLRADVIGEHGEVLESSAFSDVAIGVKPQPQSVLRPIRRLHGYRIVRPSLTPTRLEAEGWAMRQSISGFQQVSCVKRPFEDFADNQATPKNPVLQTIFSDGLTYVSLFVEPFDPQRHTRAMHASAGATQTLMDRQGDWWVTLIGDVPPATLSTFLKNLMRNPR